MNCEISCVGTVKMIFLCVVLSTSPTPAVQCSPGHFYNTLLTVIGAQQEHTSQNLEKSLCFLPRKYHD